MPRQAKRKPRTRTAARKPRAKARKTAKPAFADRSPKVRAWIRREIREQEARYRKIVREMEALEPQREQWILDFFERIQTRGYSVHAGIRRRIKPHEIPRRPRRKLRVVF
jgi:hypothetical protein